MTAEAAVKVRCNECGSSKVVVHVDDPERAECQRCLDDRGAPYKAEPTGSKRGAKVFIGGTTGVWLGAEYGARQ